MEEVKMFAKGEYVVCPNIGVCLVEDVTKQDMNKVEQSQLYYVLQPVDCKESKIYSAVDNDKMLMRKVISYDEVPQLIDGLRNISPIEINDEKKREEVYKEALKPCECIGWARLIKTIYDRKEVKAKQGKKMTATDTKYLKKAEDFLYQELAISMKLEPTQVKERILNEIGIEIS